MLETIIKYFVEVWNLSGEMSPYLLFGFLVAGILSVIIKPEYIQRHLGKSKITSVIKASLLGVPLPLCSCGVIPVSASLKKEWSQQRCHYIFFNFNTTNRSR